MSKTSAPAAPKTGHARILGRLKRERSLWAISAVALVWVAIFCYGPLYGLLYSFF